MRLHIVGLNHQRVGLQPTALPVELPVLHLFFGGGGRNRTHKALRRLVYSQVISPVNAPPEYGADGEHRTHNLLFTRQLLCRD